MNTLEIADVEVEKLDTAKPLAVIFEPYQTTLAKWEAKASSLKVTRLDQKTEMAQARLARLEIKQARVDLDKKRKELVEHLKTRTSKIDTAARLIREKCEELEAQLLESELFAERHAEFEKAKLKARRECEINPYLTEPVTTDLSELTDEQYAGWLFNAKAGFEARKAEAARLESERLAKIEADRVEHERTKAENARLQAEHRKQQAELAKQVEAAAAEQKKLREEQEAERKKQQAELDRLAEAKRKEVAALELKAKEEREKTEKLQAEIRARQQQEEKERKAREAADRRAKNAPDAQKLRTMAETIRGLRKSLSSLDLNTRVDAELTRAADWLTKTADSL
jgi:hypothetical protein